MEYVLAYIEDLSGRIIFVEKDSPEWQRGRFNLPGGKIESGENPETACRREIAEECGIYNHQILSGKLVGKIVGKHDFEGNSPFTIYVFHIKLNQTNFLINPSEGETEKFFWVIPSFAIEDPRVLPNLKIMIPLINFGVIDWVLSDNNLNFSLDDLKWTIILKR